MKVLVVGTGSIGRRHIANLLESGAIVEAFSYRGLDHGYHDRPGLTFVADLEAALDGDCDAVVVANRTDRHMTTAIAAARRGKAVFIEKPLSVSLAGSDELLRLTRARSLVVEVGFMLRCHPNLLWIKRQLDEQVIGNLMHVHAYVGQWLPDWRPSTDHRTGYGAKRETGGGVIFDLIHELDVVNWLCGPVEEVTAMTRRVPQLEIDTEAIAQVGLRLSSGALAQVHLDYVRPSYARRLEVVGDKGVLSWDYTEGLVHFTSRDATRVAHRVPDGFERNSMFREHMRVFQERVFSNALPALSTLESAIATQRIALASHKSSALGRHVRPDQIDADFAP